MEQLIAGFFIALFADIFLFGLLRTLAFYTIVQEGTCVVYELFGKPILVILEPGLHFLWPKLLLNALFFPIFGKTYRLDMRRDQRYLRSQPVNSEEGAPMGIGIWYEMFISDPISFLYKNTDPEGSLAANVSNATVRCLSNMPLAKMLEDRHTMSLTVRSDVTPQSREWGYGLGSTYIRKVHFRDKEMTSQIEDKVVNRLRQVTAAIKQDGENRVNIIASSAQKTAASEIAKAAAIRPQIVGKALEQISQDSNVARALFEVLECQKIKDSEAKLTLLPANGGQMLSELLASQEMVKA